MIYKMQIKIFQSKDAETIEKDINDFANELNEKESYVKSIKVNNNKDGYVGFMVYTTKPDVEKDYNNSYWD